MNREHKYRVWDSKYAKMYSEGICIYADGTFDIQRTAEDGRAIETAESQDGELVLIQYTGLKENEGGQEREIYEDDIILHGSGKLRGPGVVKWDELHCGFKVFRGHNRFDIYRPQIIGNIHENPELIPAS